MTSKERAKQLLEALPETARVIELAGPTPVGNEFLQRNDIHIKAKPWMTNRENLALFYGLPPYPKEMAVDEIADVRSLQYHNVDLFLCSYLTWFNDRRYTKKQLPKRLLAKLHWKLRYTPSRANLHISLFRETAKSLKPGGLLVVEGLWGEDFPVATKCGFEVIYQDDDAALFQRA